VNRKRSLKFVLIALIILIVPNVTITMPIKKGITTSATLGPAVFPIPGIRFQYRFNNHLSLNTGLSYIFAVGDFNAGINLHLPMGSIDPYLGVRGIFLYHITGTIELGAAVVGTSTDKFFVEAGLGFGQSKTEHGSDQTELAIFQIGWFF
jgi:hypothetical protein